MVAVKIDNVSDGPQTGLNAADVVYLEQVEGGLTRLLALFASPLPTAAGPVRSARASDLVLLAQYGRVALAFSGANAGVLASVRAANVQDDSYDVVPGAYSFDYSRPAPYRFLVDIAALARNDAGVSTRYVGFRFGALPATNAVAPAVWFPRLVVRYPDATVGFRWTGQQWLVSRDGSPEMLTDGSQASAVNVLVQFVVLSASGYVDHNGNPTPFSVTVGSGGAALFRGGHRYLGTWSRPVAADPTTWKSAAGGPLRLAPGRTWVLLVPIGTPLQTQ